MLRPKQLLPLYNGARAWLVAGTCKSTSFDDTYGSEVSHFDEEGKNGKCGNVHNSNIVSPYTAETCNGKHFNCSSKEGAPSAVDSVNRAHALHASFVDGFVQVPLSPRNLMKQPSSRSAGTVGSGLSCGNPESLSRILPMSAVGRLKTEIYNEDHCKHNETLTDRVCKVGIAAAGKLSNPRDALGIGKRGDESLYMVQRGGPSSSANVSRQKMKPDCSGKSYRPSIQSERNVPGLYYGGAFGNQAGTNFSNAHKDARRFSSCTQHNNSQGDFSSQLDVLAQGFKSMAMSPQMLQAPGISDAAAVSGRKDRRLKEARIKPLMLADDSIPGTNCWPVKSECQSAVQGLSRLGEASRPAQETYHRAGNAGQSNGSRQGRGAALAQRGSRNDGREVVERVCSILRQLKWSSETEDALSRLDRKLCPYHVNEVLKQLQDVELSLGFFNWAKKQDGFKHDVHTYTTMVGILGRARRFDVLSGLLEDMENDGCEPSVVTFNRLIHCHGRANQMEKALQIFHHMQQVGCNPDKVTYCTLIDLHAKAGFLDVAMDMYRQMQQAGLQPDTFTFSVIINCLGKAGEMLAAHKVYNEMIAKGCTPNLVTYNILIDLYAKSGKYDMALKLYNDMQEKGFRPDQVTYSIVMEVLGHVGHLVEAEYVFAEMQEAGWAPDMTVYGLLVDMWGKAGKVAKACEWYNKMLDSGIMPNVPTCNSLLGAFLRENLYDAGMQVLQDMLEWDLKPSLQTYTLLLSCYTMSERPCDCEIVWKLMGSTGHSAHTFLCSLPGVNFDGKDTREHTVSFFNTICCETQESKRSFTDASISFLHKYNMKAEAAIVWEVAIEKKVYPKALTKKAPKYWAINLHTMSMGTAIVALSRTLSSLKDQMLTTGVVPERIDIITGWGRRSRVTGSSLVKQAIEGILQTSSSPFHVDNGNLGCLVGIGKPLADWLNESDMEQMHLI